MSLSLCAALKIPTQATIKVGGRKLSLAPDEICEIYKEWSEGHDSSVVFLTNRVITSKHRSKIDKTLIYVDRDTAYLVDVVKVGPMWPNTLVKVPDNFTPPDIFRSGEYRSWLALSGKWVPVNPSNYYSDSDSKCITDIFSTNATMSYVHKA